MKKKKDDGWWQSQEDDERWQVAAKPKSTWLKVVLQVA